MAREKILFWVNAIFYFIFWCVMLFKPDIALQTFIIVFWIESILSWIIWTILAIKDKGSEEKWLLAGLSIFQILVWVWLAFFPEFGEKIIEIFIVLIWIWIVIRWILLLVDSFRLKKGKFTKWYWALIAWCCLIILGTFLVLNSLRVILIMNSVIGLWMIIVGISMIIWVLQLKKEIKRELEA